MPLTCNNWGVGCQMFLILPQARYEEKVTSKFSEGGSILVNEKETFSQVLVPAQYAHFQLFGGSKKAAKKDKIEKLKLQIREGMDAQMQAKLHEITAKYEAKYNAMKEKYDAMQTQLDELKRQIDNHSVYNHKNKTMIMIGKTCGRKKWDCKRSTSPTRGTRRR